MVAVTSLEGAVPAQRARVGAGRCVPTRTQRGGDFRVWPDCVHVACRRLFVCNMGLFYCVIHPGCRWTGRSVQTRRQNGSGIAAQRDFAEMS